MRARGRVALLLLAPCLLLAGAASLDAQDAPRDTVRGRGPADTSEEIRIDITERRIVETGLEAARALEVRTDRLLLQAGVSIAARQVQIALHGIRIRGRFHVTLERIRHLLDETDEPRSR